MFRRHRPARPLQQMLGLAVAKSTAVTVAFLAGHVSLSVATDLYGFASPEQPRDTPVVVEVATSPVP